MEFEGGKLGYWEKGRQLKGIFNKEETGDHGIHLS